MAEIAERAQIQALDFFAGSYEPELLDAFMRSPHLRYMTMFKMIEPRPIFGAYIERLNQRPALQRTDAKNATVMKERDIKMPGQN